MFGPSWINLPIETVRSKVHQPLTSMFPILPSSSRLSRKEKEKVASREQREEWAFTFPLTNLCSQIVSLDKIAKYFENICCISYVEPRLKERPLYKTE